MFHFWRKLIASQRFHFISGKRRIIKRRRSRTKVSENMWNVFIYCQFIMPNSKCTVWENLSQDTSRCVCMLKCVRINPCFERMGVCVCVCVIGIRAELVYNAQTQSTTVFRKMFSSRHYEFDAAYIDSKCYCIGRSAVWIYAWKIIFTVFGIGLYFHVRTHTEHSWSERWKRFLLGTQKFSLQDASFARYLSHLWK